MNYIMEQRAKDAPSYFKWSTLGYSRFKIVAWATVLEFKMLDRSHDFRYRNVR